MLAIAFGTLLALIALTGLSALQGARRIFGEVSSAHMRYQEGERILAQVRSEIHQSGTLVRDFLLDRSNLTAESYREQLLELRSAIPGELKTLRGIIGAQNVNQLDRLEQELDSYWNAFDPIFTWTPGEKLAFSSAFLRQQVLPRRDAALAIAREVRALNEANLERQRKEVEQKEGELPIYVRRMLLMTLFLGALVAALSIFRINRLEERAESARRRTERAESEMRRLSQQLLKAHEEECRVISRELHDEIGQMLTAQRMELRNLKALRTAPEEEFMKHLEDSARLSEDALRAVRGLAMGLRPSMLDDLGLGPAVEWQAREFSRRYGVPVTVQLEGPLESAPDALRTCVYRVVQEALTNCARHARARQIRIAVHAQESELSLTIQDDGAGFSAEERRGQGAGLIGMEERVRELGGRFAIYSQPGRGTALTASIPLGAKEEAAV